MCVMRRGTSLLELLLVIVIIGLAALITVPSLRHPLAVITVETEAQRVARAHVRARMLALTTNRMAVLRLEPDSLSIDLVDNGDTTPAWREGGPALRGVLLTGPTRPILVAPSGIGVGVSNGTWVLEYRGVRRSVVFSRLGRTRVVR